jgi:NurA domain
MGYSSRRGRRPDESASKSAHSYVVKDPEVQGFLAQCNLPKKLADVSFAGHICLRHQPITANPIRHVIAVDGGYTEVVVEKQFPSSTLCFFQFGALIFGVEDLETIERSPFIDPEDIAKLKHIQRLKLTLPTRNITMKSCASMIDSVRSAIHSFFSQISEDQSLNETLRWFIFREYETPLIAWTLSSCPNPVCGERNISLLRSQITDQYTFECAKCSKQLFLIDVFRLHEAIDNELGAGGILGYVTTTIEQLVLVHLIRLILRTKPALLKHALFIKDGPLAFFGQTANMHEPMRALVRFLFDTHDLYLTGLEKSGPFVEHADEISQVLDNGSVLLLDDAYIYRYIVPGTADPSSPYGRSTYYGNKLIFKTSRGSMYVASLPTIAPNFKPAESDFRNLAVILSNIEKLKCDMYDNSLIPVALANKLISLANHPSSRILQKFAADAVPH